MNFGEAVAALDALAAEGVVVSATVSGTDDAAAPIASLGGLLRRMEVDPQFLDLLGGDLREALRGAETAVVFVVGDSRYTFDLWPSRFTAPTVDETNGVTIITRDGRLRVYKNRPWID